MKVIFLDVDGVLNCDDTEEFTKSGGFIFVENRFLHELKRIINETGAKIVLSSDWRIDRDDPKLNGDYIELQQRLWSVCNLFFFDFTPEINRGRDRGIEIDAWLSRHSDVEKFVILDDRDDMAPHMDKLVQTNYRDGLTKEIADKAIEMLR